MPIRHHLIDIAGDRHAVLQHDLDLRAGRLIGNDLLGPPRFTGLLVLRIERHGDQTVTVQEDHAAAPIACRKERVRAVQQIARPFHPGVRFRAVAQKEIDEQR